MDNLQEAYLNVYSSEGYKPINQEKIDRKRESVKKKEDIATYQRRYDDADKQYKRGVALTFKKKMSEIGMKEDVDVYDLILSHLIDEGYASTEESATTIMANMSEGWREEILEVYKDFPTAKVTKKAGDLMGSSAGKTDEKSKKKEKRGIKMMDTMMQHTPDR
jgi:hypothetical protein